MSENELSIDDLFRSIGIAPPGRIDIDAPLRYRVTRRVSRVVKATFVAFGLQQRSDEWMPRCGWPVR